MEPNNSGETSQATSNSALDGVLGVIHKAYPPKKPIGDNALLSNAAESIVAAEAIVWMMLLGILLALVILLIMSGWAGGIRTIGLNSLLGVCAGCVGGIIGFLFGIPHSPTTAVTAGYRPSTNLEQVSDWLTKIILGVGLIQADAIANRLAITGKLVADVVPKQGPVVPQIIIVVFAALGFFTAYVWTRLYYGGMQMQADNSVQDRLAAVENQQKTTEVTVSEQGAKTSALEAKADTLATQTSEIGKTAVLLAKGELGTPTVPLPEPGTNKIAGLAPPLDDATADIQKRVQAFLDAPVIYDADPGADVFAELKPRKSADGLELQVHILTTLSQGLTLQAVVAPVADPSLTGDVVFLLHPTYNPRRVQLPVQGGQVAYNFFAAEWFTLVAVANGGKTLLSYDLRDVPNAPDWFKGIGPRP